MSLDDIDELMKRLELASRELEEVAEGRLEPDGYGASPLMRASDFLELETTQDIGKKESELTEDEKAERQMYLACIQALDRAATHLRDVR